MVALAGHRPGRDETAARELADARVNRGRKLDRVVGEARTPRPGLEAASTSSGSRSSAQSVRAASWAGRRHVHREERRRLGRANDRTDQSERQCKAAHQRLPLPGAVPRRGEATRGGRKAGVTLSASRARWLHERHRLGTTTRDRLIVEKQVLLAKVFRKGAEVNPQYVAWVADGGDITTPL